MKLSVIVATYSFLFLNLTLHAAPKYTITDLGAFTRSGDSDGFAINNKGQVTGRSGDHAFLYDGTLHDLGTIGGQFSNGFGISESGLITGSSTNSAIGWRAYLYDGSMHDLGTLDSPHLWSWGSDINDKGHVVGYSAVSGTEFHAFLYDGAMHDLGTFGGTYSEAKDINDNGLVVGIARVLEGDADHAFLYDGTMHDLGTLGGSASGAAGINAVGQVTGAFTATDGQQHAFFYDGTMHDLGLFNGRSTSGHSINASGTIVGIHVTPGGSGLDELALLYSPDIGMVDLNTQIDPASGWVLISAEGINDAGQIVGSGHIGGKRRAYLLTPVPEPSAIALAAVGFTGLLCRRLHRRRSSSA